MDLWLPITLSFLFLVHPVLRGSEQNCPVNAITVRSIAHNGSNLALRGRNNLGECIKF